MSGQHGRPNVVPTAVANALLALLLCTAIACVCNLSSPEPAHASLLSNLPVGSKIDATSCAWQIHTDGRQSGFGFNDRNAAYSGTIMFTDLPGGHWQFDGEYPRARWISFESYDNAIASQGSLSGTHIRPDDPALLSPFAPHGTAKPGDHFTVDLVNAKPADRMPDPSNLLYGGYRMDPSYGGLMHSVIQSVLYRVYDAPRTVDTLGGVPRPKVEWVVDDPATNLFSSTADVCASLKTAELLYQPWPTLVKSLEALNDPVIKPLLVPLASYVQGLSPDLSKIPNVHVIRPNSNGYQNLYFNSKTPYIGLIPNRSQGVELVVRFKAPTFTKIERGKVPTGQEQVGYWDWCSTQFLTPLNYTIACRRDEQFHIDKHGYATLVISTAADRPIVNGHPYRDWLPMAGNLGMTVMRQLEPNPVTFPESPYYLPQVKLLGQSLPVDILPGESFEPQIKAQMGAYYPDATYCSKDAFELNRCGLGSGT